jgi:hypothetical protein
MPTEPQSPGLELTVTLVGMVLGIALPLLVQQWDRRRLGLEARERAWNVATWGSALYAFGPLSMLGWCWVTRRGWGKALGVPVAAALVLLIELGVAGIAAVWTALAGG